MNAKQGKQTSSQNNETNFVDNNGDFNFERWANEVRPRLIAALRKRGGLAS